MTMFEYKGEQFDASPAGLQKLIDGKWNAYSTNDDALYAAAAAADPSYNTEVEAPPPFTGNTAPPPTTAAKPPVAPTTPTQDAPGASGASFDQAGILAHYGRVGWTVKETRPEMVEDKSPAAELNKQKTGVPQKKATGRTVWQIKSASDTNAAIQELLVEEDPNGPQYGPDAQNPASAKFRPAGEPTAVSPGDTKGADGATPRVSLEKRGGKMYAVDYTNPKNVTYSEVQGLPPDTPPDKTQLVGPDKDGNYNVVNIGTDPPTTTLVPGLKGKPDPTEARTIYTDNTGAWSVGKDGVPTPIKGPDGKQLGGKPGESITDTATGLQYTMGPNGNAIPVRGPDGKQLGGNKPSNRHNITDAATNHVISVSDTDPNDKVDTGITGDASAVFLIGDSKSKKLSLVNKATGETVRTWDNEAWQPEQPTEIAPNTVAPFIHKLIQNPETGVWETKSVPNDNQLTISQAMMETLVPEIAAKMKSGEIDAQTGKDLLTAWSNKTKDEISAANAATTAANTSLDSLNTAATTGATILNNRANNASSQMNNWVNAIGGNKNLGLGSTLSSNFAGNLVGGIGAWSAEMAGGQGVIDRATAAVNAIDPDSPQAAPNHATLLKMQQHMGAMVPGAAPQTVATATPLTGNQSATPAPVVAPAPVAAPVAPAPTWNLADHENVSKAPLNPVTGLPVAGVTGTVDPNDPRRLSVPTFTPPQFPGRGMQW